MNIKIVAQAVFFSFFGVFSPIGASVPVDAPPQKELIEKSLPKITPYSPYAGRNYPTRVFWGDTHLHTSFSFDAGSFGNRLGPEDAYRFARGEEVVSSSGKKVKLFRPLDFLVVADHSEQMGFFPMLLNGDPKVMSDPVGKRWHEAINKGGQDAADATLDMIDKFSKGKIPPTLIIDDPDSIGSVWEKVIDAAEKFNDPGTFTSFIGYEWTSMTPPGNNLHRVVIFRDNGDKAGQIIPFSSMDSMDPEDLWSAMDAYEEKTGGRVLAIPHNGNLSNGEMFTIQDMKGNPISKEYAIKRNKREPVYEVTQIKGDGEAHPYLSPNDEFADYETWDKGNLNLSAGKTKEMLQYEYARSALKLGLKLKKELGVNPFKFGMIGSTDSHTSLSAVEEENFFGKHAGTEPNPERMSHPFIEVDDLKIMGWEEVASGYAGVWATDNTRRAIFDALKRKEVYGTTGPRMIVRFFGGWEFTDKDAQSRNPASTGYSKGVPMGGDLSLAPSGKSPSFLVGAMKDPIGANIDRIQIIKGWLDQSGELQEKVYNVALSDNRQNDKEGKAPPVGNTVDVKNAIWTNTIGDPELVSVWTDPDFNPNVHAFYYVRVLQIPTPRWTAYDAKRFNVDPPKEARMTTQERAYTSPIWYTPTM